MKNKKLIFLLLSGILLIALGTVQMYFNPNQKRQPVEIPPTQGNQKCDVRKGCTLPNGSHVRMFGKISDEKPFRVDVYNVPDDIKTMYAEFSMQDMDMGFNRYSFKPSDAQRKTWRAEQLYLPICIVARTDYQMTLCMNGVCFQTDFQAD